MSDTLLNELIDRRDIIDSVIGLFVATDQRDWALVENCLAAEVVLDMTSLAGGVPAKLNGAQVAAGWREGLEPIDHVHHQVGNFSVCVEGDEAIVACYGIAYHHRAVDTPENLRTFVGSYDIQLRRTSAGWRITLFRFNCKFVTGNLQLEAAT